MRIAAVLALSLLASAAAAEPAPQLDPSLASPPIADEGAARPYGVVPGAPRPPALWQPRLKLDATLSSPGPVVEVHGLKPSDAILAPPQADAAAFEASEPTGPATRK